MKNEIMVVLEKYETEKRLIIEGANTAEDVLSEVVPNWWYSEARASFVDQVQAKLDRAKEDAISWIRGYMEYM